MRVSTDVQPDMTSSILSYGYIGLYLQQPIGYNLICAAQTPTRHRLSWVEHHRLLARSVVVSPTPAGLRIPELWHLTCSDVMCLTAPSFVWSTIRCEICSLSLYLYLYILRVYTWGTIQVTYAGMTSLSGSHLLVQR